jgi:hypothetical protein
MTQPGSAVGTADYSYDLHDIPPAALDAIQYGEALRCHVELTCMAERGQSRAGGTAG